MSHTSYRHALQQLQAMAALLIADSEHARWLDLGCGGGEILSALRQQGVDSYGCDFESALAYYDVHPPSPAIPDEYKAYITRIEEEPYRLPYEDEAFDIIISSQVMEHVMDYPKTLAEMHRVMKNGAIAIHIFPSRYKLIEPHVHVPFACFFRPLWWLKLWALLGVRTFYQQGWSAQATAENNYTYLAAQTNYLTRRQLLAHSKPFTQVQFAEALLLKVGQGKKFNWARRLSSLFPFIPKLISAFHTRVLILRK